MSFLALDWGQRFVGYATSDADGVLITARGSFERKVQPEQTWLLTQKDIDKIQAIIQEWEIEKIILGLPLNADGSESSNSIKAKELAHKIQKHFSLDCIPTDERLTSWEAKSSNNHAEAAALILKNYFMNRKAL